MLPEEFVFLECQQSQQQLRVASQSRVSIPIESRVSAATENCVSTSLEFAFTLDQHDDRVYKGRVLSHARSMSLLLQLV